MDDVVVVVADGDRWGTRLLAVGVSAGTGTGWYLLAGLGRWASFTAAKHRRRDFSAESTLQ